MLPGRPQAAAAFCIRRYVQTVHTTLGLAPEFAQFRVAVPVGRAHLLGAVLRPNAARLGSVRCAVRRGHRGLVRPDPAARCRPRWRLPCPGFKRHLPCPLRAGSRAVTGPLPSALCPRISSRFCAPVQAFPSAATPIAAVRSAPSVHRSFRRFPLRPPTSSPTPSPEVSFTPRTAPASVPVPVRPGRGFLSMIRSVLEDPAPGHNRPGARYPQTPFHTASSGVRKGLYGGRRHPSSRPCTPPSWAVLSCGFALPDAPVIRAGLCPSPPLKSGRSRRPLPHARYAVR